MDPQANNTSIPMTDMSSSPTSVQSPTAASASRSDFSATSVATSYLKNTFSSWKDERFKSLRPVGSFFSKDSYSLPKVTAIPKRIATNLKYYQTNYLVIFFLLSIYGA